MATAAFAAALTMASSAACTSSSKKSTSSTSAPPSSGAPAPPSGAATGELSFEVSGDLSGTTDALSTRVSRCTSVNGQFFFEGTVSLGGSELDVKLSLTPDPSIEIDDLASGRTWTAPSERDPAATISMQPDSATSGSFTAAPALTDTTAPGEPSDEPTPRLAVRGTYSC